MRRFMIILFAVVLAVCSGCTTVRDYYGSAVNLQGKGERIPAGTHLKISVTCFGDAPSGDHFLSLRLRGEDCWLVLFHPPIKTASAPRADTTSGVARAWLVRGKKPDCAALGRSGRDAAFLTQRGERLCGSIEVLWRDDDDFYIPVELDSETSETAVHGQFAAYTALWKPLVGPAMLLGFGGARMPKE